MNETFFPESIVVLQRLVNWNKCLIRPSIKTHLWKIALIVFVAEEKNKFDAMSAFDIQLNPSMPLFCRCFYFQTTVNRNFFPLNCSICKSNHNGGALEQTKKKTMKLI